MNPLIMSSSLRNNPGSPIDGKAFFASPHKQFHFDECYKINISLQMKGNILLLFFNCFHSITKRCGIQADFNRFDIGKLGQPGN